MYSIPERGQHIISFTNMCARTIQSEERENNGSINGIEHLKITLSKHSVRNAYYGNLHFSSLLHYNQTRLSP